MTQKFIDDESNAQRSYVAEKYKDAFKNGSFRNRRLPARRQSRSAADNSPASTAKDLAEGGATSNSAGRKHSSSAGRSVSEDGSTGRAAADSSHPDDSHSEDDTPASDVTALTGVTGAPNSGSGGFANSIDSVSGTTAEGTATGIAAGGENGERQLRETGSGSTANTRPKLSYKTLIAMAITQSPHRRATRSEICAYFTRRFPYFKQNKRVWVHAVSCTLCSSKCFVKVPREDGRVNDWTIDPQYQDMYKNSKFRPSRDLKQPVRKARKVSRGNDIANCPRDVQQQPPRAAAAATTITTTTTTGPGVSDGGRQTACASRPPDCDGYKKSSTTTTTTGLMIPKASAPYTKPPFCYAELIAMALAHSSHRRATVSEILAYVKNRFPYYKCCKQGWQKALQNKLSVSRWFVKVLRQGNKRMPYWQLDPKYEHLFKGGNYRQVARRDRQRQERAMSESAGLPDTGPADIRTSDDGGGGDSLPLPSYLRCVKYEPRSPESPEENGSESFDERNFQNATDDETVMQREESAGLMSSSVPAPETATCENDAFADVPLSICDVRSIKIEVFEDALVTSGLSNCIKQEPDLELGLYGAENELAATQGDTSDVASTAAVTSRSLSVSDVGRPSAAAPDSSRAGGSCYEDDVPATDVSTSVGDAETVAYTSGAASGSVGGGKGNATSLPASVADEERRLGGSGSTNNVHTRPLLTYKALIAQAIEESPHRRLTMPEIYCYLIGRFPYFEKKKKSFRAVICCTLSANKCFLKVPQEGSCFNYWMLDPKYKNTANYRRRHSREWPGHKGLGVEAAPQEPPRTSNASVHDSPPEQPQSRRDSGEHSTPSRAIPIASKPGRTPTVDGTASVGDAGAVTATCSSAIGRVGSGSSVAGEERRCGGADTKPPFSYAELCAMAIAQAPGRRATYSEIYTYIENRFPYYRNLTNWWQRSVRSNLSVNKCFVKKAGQHGAWYWTLDPKYERRFEGVISLQYVHAEWPVAAAAGELRDTGDGGTRRLWERQHRDGLSARELDEHSSATPSNEPAATDSPHPGDFSSEVHTLAPERKMSADDTTTATSPYGGCAERRIGVESNDEAATSVGSAATGVVKEETSGDGGPASTAQSKPPFSYEELTAMAILESPHRNATLSEIKAYITSCFPYYEFMKENLQNPIHSTLYFSKYFIKAPLEGERRNCWMLDPKYVDRFKIGKFKQHQIAKQPLSKGLKVMTPSDEQERSLGLAARPQLEAAVRDHSATNQTSTHLRNSECNSNGRAALDSSCRGSAYCKDEAPVLKVMSVTDEAGSQAVASCGTTNGVSAGTVSSEGVAGGDGAADTQPQLTCKQLITLAIMNSPHRKATLSEIYAYISTRYPSFRQRRKVHLHKISTKLSCSKCFVKVPQEGGSSRGCWWTLGTKSKGGAATSSSPSGGPDNHCSGVSKVAREGTTLGNAAKMKPPFSYEELIAMAILDSLHRRATMSEIIAYIARRFPYFERSNRSWQKSISCTLSFSKYFVKVPLRGVNSKGRCLNHWMLGPKYKQALNTGKFRQLQGSKRPLRRALVELPVATPPPNTATVVRAGRPAAVDEHREETTVGSAAARTDEEPSSGDHGSARVKPPFSYEQLITMAIEDSTHRRATLAEIVAYISRRFPYFERSNKSWQKSINCKLSFSKYFVKVPLQVGSVRSRCYNYWMLDPKYKNKMKKGNKKLGHHQSTKRPFREPLEEAAVTVGSARQQRDACLPAQRRPLRSLSGAAASGSATGPTSASQSVSEGGRTGWASPDSDSPHPRDGHYEDDIPAPDTVTRTGDAGATTSAPGGGVGIATSVEGGKCVGNSGSTNARPSLSHKALIAMAIAQAPHRRATRSEIYTYITRRFPYFGQKRHLWLNVISTTLSTGKWFVKVPTEDGNSTSNYWMLDPQYENVYKSSSLRLNRQSKLLFRASPKVPRGDDTTGRPRGVGRQNAGRLIRRQLPTAAERLPLEPSSLHTGAVAGELDVSDGNGDIAGGALSFSDYPHCGECEERNDRTVPTARRMSVSEAGSSGRVATNLSEPESGSCEADTTVTGVTTAAGETTTLTSAPDSEGTNTDGAADGAGEELRSGEAGPADTKPPFNYPQLCTMALEHSPHRRATWSQISAYITRHFPYFEQNQGWQKCVSNTLTRHWSFINVKQKGAKGSSSYWMLDRHYKEMIKNRNLRYLRHTKQPFREPLQRAAGCALRLQQQRYSGPPAQRRPPVHLSSQDVSGGGGVSAYSCGSTTAPTSASQSVSEDGSTGRASPDSPHPRDDHCEDDIRVSDTATRTGDAGATTSTSGGRVGIATGVEDGKCLGNSGSTNARPSLSHKALIAMAIAQAPHRRATRSEIYTYIKRRFPYFGQKRKRWLNTIGKTLSTGKWFVKVPMEGGNSKGYYWTLDPQYEDSYKNRHWKRPLRKASEVPRSALEPRSLHTTPAATDLGVCDGGGRVADGALPSSTYTQNSGYQDSSISPTSRSLSISEVGNTGWVAPNLSEPDSGHYEDDTAAKDVTTAVGVAAIPPSAPAGIADSYSDGAETDSEETTPGSADNGAGGEQYSGKAVSASGANTKPPYNYTELCTMALEHSPQRRATWSEISGYIVRRFPYFGRNGGWQNSVRNTLTRHRSFVNVKQKGAKGSSSYWMLDRHYKEMIKNRNVRCHHRTKWSLREPLEAAAVPVSSAQQQQRDFSPPAQSQLLGSSGQDASRGGRSSLAEGSISSVSSGDPPVRGGPGVQSRDSAAFPCSETKYLLRVHRKKQAGGRPYVCGICGRAFRGVFQLKRHWLLHTGERPYSCGACGRKFSRREQLKVHSVVHTGERPHRCGFCQKTFSLRFSLKRHLRKVHAAPATFGYRSLGADVTEARVDSQTR